MPQYLVAIHHPDDFDAASESETTQTDIRALNMEMRDKGVRLFAGGLRPVREAKAVRRRGDGLVVSDGPYMETKEHIGGFWILDCASLDDAVEWGRKAAMACRAPVEVREFGATPARG